MNIAFELEFKRRVNILKQKFPNIILDVDYESSFSVQLKKQNIKQTDIIFLTKNDMQVIQRNLAPQLMDDTNNLVNKHPIFLPIITPIGKSLESSKYKDTDFNLKDSSYRISSKKITRCLLRDVIDFVSLNTIGTYDLTLEQGGVFVLTPYAARDLDLSLNYDNISAQLVKNQIDSMDGGLKGHYESHGEYTQREIEAAIELKKPGGKKRTIFGKNVY